MFHSFFNSLARSRYLSFFLHSFSFILWSAGTVLLLLLLLLLLLSLLFPFFFKFSLLFLVYYNPSLSLHPRPWVREGSDYMYPMYLCFLLPFFWVIFFSYIDPNTELSIYIKLPCSLTYSVSFLNTQHYKVALKGKCTNPGKKVAPTSAHF